MNDLQIAILARAIDWLKKKAPGEIWEESGANRGEVLNALKQAYGVKPGTEAWCAMFVYVVVNQACNDVQAVNILPKTASAAGMLNGAKKTALQVNKNPAIGSVFYRKSTDPKSSGHVGIVVDVMPDKIITIEGNVDDRVGIFSYNISEFAVWAFQFIHTELMPYKGKAKGINVAGQIAELQNTGYNLRRNNDIAAVSTTNRTTTGRLEFI